MSIVLQVYPNGEFSQGVDTSKKRRSRLEQLSDRLLAARAPVRRDELCAEINAEMYDAEIERGTEFISAYGSEWTYLQRIDGIYYYAVDNSIDQPWVLESPHSPQRLVGMNILIPPDIGSSNARILEKTQKPCKKGISMTKHMARNIRNAVYLLEQDYGKDCLSFLTLTLPSVSQEGLNSIISAWGYLVNKFLKWLEYRCNKKGVCTEYVYCTEIQQKRFDSTGIYAPHLHIVFRGRSRTKSAWAVSPKQCRKEWAKLLKSCCVEQFVTSALENLQRIKRSAARYLSKYISKGCSVRPEDLEESGIQPLKSHWGGMSRSLSRGVKTCTLKATSSGGNGEVVVAFVRNMERLVAEGLLAYAKRGIIPISDSPGGGLERGLHVAVGAMATPLLQGGWDDVMAFLDKLRGK